MMNREHTYTTTVHWTGNTGEGTKTYSSYQRDFTLQSAGKPIIPGSSDPVFRGDPHRYNPEDLLVASLASCHMLAYLHLCAVNKITVLAYEDEPTGWMQETAEGAGQFTRVLLRPLVAIAPADDAARAEALHADAHHLCFIARSVNFPVDVEPRSVVQ